MIVLKAFQNTKLVYHIRPNHDPSFQNHFQHANLSLSRFASKFSQPHPRNPPLKPRHHTTMSITTAQYQASLIAMAETTTQYQTVQKGGPFALAVIPKPTAGPNEVSIRMKAIGLNPLDWKKLYFGVMVDSWPAVFGIDGAGIVEEVGEGVTKFKAGDEVFSLFGHQARASSFQEVAVVSEMDVGRKPGNISFEEAASLP